MLLVNNVERESPKPKHAKHNVYFSFLKRESPNLLKTPKSAKYNSRSSFLKRESPKAPDTKYILRSLSERVQL